MRDHQIWLQRTVYFGGILVWLMYGILFPTWIGTSYNYYDIDTMQTRTGWYRGGVFGLADAAGVELQKPIWDPPTAHSDLIHPTVLWPWQAPNQREHVEISLQRFATQTSLGILVFGFVLGVFNWIHPPRRVDRLVTIAWSITLAQVIAFLIIVVTTVLTMGFAITDTLVVGVLSGGLLVGFIHGCFASCYSNQKQSLDSVTTKTRVANANMEVRIDTNPKPAFSPGFDFLLFTTGAIVGVCISVSGFMLAGFISNSGFEYFSPRDQLIYVTTGLVIVAIGVLIGIFLIRGRKLLGLRIGFMIATSILGIAVCFFH